MKRATTFCAGPALALCLAACATPAAGPSQEQAVMKAQLAAPAQAESRDRPMSGEEADRIYQNYLDRIGKPLGPRDSATTTQ